MRKEKSSKPILLSGMVRIMPIILGAFIFIGCNNGETSSQTSPDAVGTVNWLDLKITFKPGTSSEIRNQAIENIQNMLMDTVSQIRLKSEFQNYSPDFSTDYNPNKAPLQYSIAVSVKYTLKDSCKCQCSCPIVCTCANGCGVCVQLKEVPVTPSGPNSANDSLRLRNVVDSIRLNGELISLN